MGMPKNNKRGLVALDGSSFGADLIRQTAWSDPCKWIEDQLGVSLFSNQMDIVEALRDPVGDGFNVLGCRGSGKTQGLAYGISELCENRPGTQVLITAPIEKQAGRIIRYVKSALQSPSSKVRDRVDWQSASALRLPFKDGSSIVAFSGQEKANNEGEHGHVLVIDEAHLVPSYSVTNKLIPMVGMLGGYSKIVKMGVAMGRGHFYKSVSAHGAKNVICPWDKAEIYLMEPNPFFYNGIQYSRKLIARMPLPLRVRLFPNVPELHRATGYEITELDWATQYSMEWVDDINNLLSDEDQERLAGGKHLPIIHGRSGDVYFAGLDTAYSGSKDADRTVLAIWRLRRDGVVERVASYVWQGDPLGQEKELWDILNPKQGMFKCEAIFADYSNIAINIVERFRASGLPIVGVTFGSSAKNVGSNKNWKNTLYDHFMVRLQTGEAVYPDIKQLRMMAGASEPEMKVQIDNMLEGFWQWCVIQRVRGRGLNDTIEAPTDQVEDDEGGESRVAHDDACLTGDTGVRLLDGTTKTMAELASMDLSDAWAYSVDPAGAIVAGKIKRAWKTGHRKIFRVTLDSGESFRCTPDHLIMLRDGSYACAEDLVSGQSIMPLYTKRGPLPHSKNKLDYEYTYNPQDGLFHTTHSLIHGSVPKDCVRHHVNFNRFDNRPTNLISLSWKEHAKVHGANIAKHNAKMWSSLTQEQRTARNKKSWAGDNRAKRGPGISRSTAAIKKSMGSPEARASVSRRFKGTPLPQSQIDHISDGLRTRWSSIPVEDRAGFMSAAIEAAAVYHRTTPSHRLGQRTAWHTRTCALDGCENKYTCRNSRPRQFCCQSHAALARHRDASTGIFMNHKILLVEDLGVSEDVYDLEIEGFHNFALSCGVFVHNCSADVLAVWAARHRDQMRKEMSKGGMGMVEIAIPMPVFGNTMNAPLGRFGRLSDNPYAVQPSPASQGPSSGPLDSLASPTGISGWIGLNNKPK